MDLQMQEEFECVHQEAMLLFILKKFKLWDVFCRRNVCRQIQIQHLSALTPCLSHLVNILKRVLTAWMCMTRRLLYLLKFLQIQKGLAVCMCVCVSRGQFQLSQCVVCFLFLLPVCSGVTSYFCCLKLVFCVLLRETGFSQFGLCAAV